MSLKSPGQTQSTANVSSATGVLPAINGGTGIANGSNSSITITGNTPLTFNLPASGANVTLPASGSLIATDQTATGNIRITGQFNSSVAQGTPPLLVASNTVVANLNVSLLQGGNWAAPGNNIGTTTAVPQANITLLNTTAAVNEQKRVSVYDYTPWDPSDAVGTFTNAPGTAAATSTAADYITVANSSGTLTWTCVKSGSYRFTITADNEIVGAATFLQLRVILGGTATRLSGLSQVNPLQLGTTAATSPTTNSVVFQALMTAGQTVTTLPALAVTGAGATTTYTQNVTISAEYTGTN